MKEKLVKLIDVKSIMTLLLTLVFCILALCGVISGQEFITIFTVIVGFYFGTQSQKSGATAPQPSTEPTGTVPDSTTYTTETVDAATVQANHPLDPGIENT